MIPQSEYSPEFDELRRNRCIQSYYKYGSARINFGDGLVDAVESAKMCIAAFEKTLNKEYLCDAANYLMFEFMYSTKTGVYFKATSSEESAGKAGISINEMIEK